MLQIVKGNYTSLWTPFKIYFLVTDSLAGSQLQLELCHWIYA